MQTDDLFWGKLVPSIWFPLGLAGLAVIGSVCHDEALGGEFHL